MFYPVNFMKIILQSKLKKKLFFKKEFNLIFKQNNQRKWLAMIYLVIFFILELMVITNNSFITNFDSSIQTILQGMVSSGFTSIFKTVTFLGSPLMDLIYLLLIAFLFLKNNYKQTALWIIYLLISGNIISFLIKITVHRQRPLNAILPASGYSFPSGHVFGTTLLILTIIFLVLPHLHNKNWRIGISVIAILWLILVAFSRVYLRGHFPSDVLGSALLAGTWWEFSELLYLRYHATIINLFKFHLGNQKE